MSSTFNSLCFAKTAECARRTFLRTLIHCSAALNPKPSVYTQGCAFIDMDGCLGQTLGQGILGGSMTT